MHPVSTRRGSAFRPPTRPPLTLRLGDAGAALWGSRACAQTSVQLATLAAWDGGGAAWRARSRLRAATRFIRRLLCEKAHERQLGA